MIKVHILSDPICPWCLIGKSKLDRALNEIPNAGWKSYWMPFQLNPEMPANGMDRKEYLKAKFGSHDNATNVYKPIVSEILKNNLSVNFNEIKRTPNTLNAHRLIYWAHIEGLQERVVSEIFKAYFENGKDIGEKSVLTSIAETAGMNKMVVSRLLEGDADSETVLSMDNKYRNAGVTGVPTFILNDRYVISGAQKEQFWIETINEIITKSQKKDPS